MDPKNGLLSPIIYLEESENNAEKGLYTDNCLFIVYADGIIIWIQK